MNFCIAFHAGDRDQFARWAAWVAELGGMGSHRLFVMPGKGVPIPECPLPHTVVPDCYGIVTNWSGNEAIRDAAGANSMVRQFAMHFCMNELGPWMFVEPDAIPTRPGWQDEFDREYADCGKAFMGARILGKPGEYVEHSTGNMVFPQNAAHIEKLMLPTRGPGGIEIAFDVAAATAVLSNFHDTKLIQQIFRGEPFRTEEDFKKVRPETALFHTDKTFSLLPFLRNKIHGEPSIAQYIVLTRDAGAMDGVVSPCPHSVEFEAGISEQPKPIVHTYFSPSSHANTRAEQEKVVAIWRSNWMAAGWDARVLTEEDAKRHPKYEDFRSGFEKLPIKNPKEYEMACFMRWVAMEAAGHEHVNLLVDYDVLTNGFPNGVSAGINLLHCFCNHVPCATCGEKFRYGLWAQQFVDFQRESDMQALEIRKDAPNPFFTYDHQCIEYGQPGWEQAKLIHFAHFACGKRKRSEVMAEWVMRDPTDEPDLTPKLSESIAIVYSVKDAIDALKEHAKKDGFAKGRIIKQLKAAGLFPKK